jgi:Ser/Thr protein kinase RdoA (MazF antagonist)
MIRYADRDEAVFALKHWGGDASSLEHLGDFGNSVWRFRNLETDWQILRLTDSTFRTQSECLGELEFLEHLSRHCVDANAAVRTNSGDLCVPCKDGKLIAASVTYSQGERVEETSTHWNSKLFAAWGRNLAQIHQASRSFAGSGRWDWNQEILIRKADDLLPKADEQSRAEFDEIMNRCLALPRADFGMIHADHAPQNFHFDPKREIVTSFDFGNSCYHWFLADIAVALSTVRRRTNRDEIRMHLLNGYGELPSNHEILIDLFIRLRVLYYYLSRLYKFGKCPTIEEQTILHLGMSAVHRRSGW